VAEAILIGRSLQRQGFSIVPKWRGLDAPTRLVIREYVPSITGALLMSSTILINQAIAGMLPARSVSALSYGNKIVSFVAGIGALSLGTAVMTQFSRMVAARDFRGIRHTLRTYVVWVLATTVPLSVLLIACSSWIVRIVFERGAFTAEDTALVSRVQAFYLIQLPPYILGTLVVRLISSLKGNRILMWGAVLNLFVNITLGYCLTRWLGVAGLALATSGVYLISASFLMFMCFRHLKQTEAELEAPE
jgi:putative peptidoglycan lipid II flippase